MATRQYNKRVATNAPYVDNGIIRHDIRKFFNNFIFVCDEDKVLAYKMTYGKDLDLTSINVYMKKLFKCKEVKNLYDSLLHEKVARSLISIQMKDMLDNLKSTGKHKEYTDLLKVYLQHLKDSNTAPNTKPQDDSEALDSITL